MANFLEELKNYFDTHSAEEIRERLKKYDDIDNIGITVEEFLENHLLPVRSYVVIQEEGYWDDNQSHTCFVTHTYNSAIIFIAKNVLDTDQYHSYYIQEWENGQHIQTYKFQQIDSDNYKSMLDLNDEDLIKVYKIN